MILHTAHIPKVRKTGLPLLFLEKYMYSFRDIKKEAPYLSASGSEKNIFVFITPTKSITQSFIQKHHHIPQ